MNLSDFNRLEELKSFTPSAFFQQHPYLIWKKAR